MIDVMVMVDDAVQGDLPMVCARTGGPADGLRRIHQPISDRSGWTWLLIFLGPIGWIAFLAVSFATRSRDLLVRLPYSQDALNAERGQYRAAVIAGAATVVAGVGALVSLAPGTARSNVRETIGGLFLAMMAAAFIAAVAFAVRYKARRPRIELDASGRWVTLRNVAPGFSDAVTERARNNGTDLARA